MNGQETTPQTLMQAVKHFADPDICHEFVASLRWPDGVACPYCHSKNIGHIKSRRMFQCKDCRKQFSVKVGTIFEDSPLGLDKWLCAIWMVANCKNGIVSYEMARDLGITQKSAWHMLHRIRLAMDSNSFEKGSRNRWCGSRRQRTSLYDQPTYDRNRASGFGERNHRGR